MPPAQPTSIRDLVARERDRLADLLAQAGPQAPTLCEGWQARDLAAHLVVRERRPDSLPGVVLSPLAPWTERVRQARAAAPFDATVQALRTGPPRWSPFALPGAYRGNLTEFFIHAEDVRRGGSGWEPRELEPAYRQALWASLAGAARLMLRRSPVGVVLVGPDGRRRVARTGTSSVELAGEPGELLLHCSGRGGSARVEVSGPQDALATYAGFSPGI